MESRALLIFLIALKCVFCSVNPQHSDLLKVTASRTSPRGYDSIIRKDTGFAPLGAVGAHGAVLLLNGKDARQCAIRDRARRQGEGESHYRDETPLQPGIPQTANLNRNGTESEYQNLGYDRFSTRSCSSIPHLVR